ncbi:hypothetical protein HYS91_04190 [Candidatus Daviesbacteria bacterium]|nr:hypothetical protein [Candidatus Daviesbacteria bacterium]
MNKWAFVNIIIFLFFVVIYWFGGKGDYNELGQNIIYLATPLMSLISGVYALFVLGLKGMRASSIFLIILGLASWFVGEVIWVLYDFILQIDPFPSHADLFYILGYPLIFAGLIKEVTHANISLKKFNLGVLFLLGLVSVLLGSLVLYFGVYLPLLRQISLLESLVAISYGMGDLILLFLSILVLIVAREYKEGKLSLPWFYFFLGLVATLVADISFAIFTKEYELKIPLFKNLLDSLWALGYLFFGYSLYKMGSVVRETQKKLLERVKN